MLFLFQGCILRFHVNLPGCIFGVCLWLLVALPFTSARKAICGLWMAVGHQKIESSSFPVTVVANNPKPKHKDSVESPIMPWKAVYVHKYTYTVYTVYVMSADVFTILFLTFLLLSWPY